WRWAHRRRTGRECSRGGAPPAAEVLRVGGRHLGAGLGELLRGEGTLFGLPLLYYGPAGSQPQIALGGAGDEPGAWDGFFFGDAGQRLGQGFVESDGYLLGGHTSTIAWYGASVGDLRGRTAPSGSGATARCPLGFLRRPPFLLAPRGDEPGESTLQVHFPAFFFAWIGHTCFYLQKCRKVFSRPQVGGTLSRGTRRGRRTSHSCRRRETRLFPVGPQLPR